MIIAAAKGIKLTNLQGILLTLILAWGCSSFATAPAVESESLNLNSEIGSSEAANSKTTKDTSDAKEAKDDKGAKIAKKLEPQSEAEIALNLEKENKANEAGSATAKVVLALVVLSMLAGAAFILLKKYSFKTKTSKHQPQIKMITQHHLGPKKSLAIVRVAGESILLGITDHNISMIKSLSLLDEEMPAEVPKNFAQLVNQRDSEAYDKDLAGSIKDDVVKRLQDMRNL